MHGWEIWPIRRRNVAFEAGSKAIVAQRVGIMSTIAVRRVFKGYKTRTAPLVIWLYDPKGLTISPWTIYSPHES
jgi:hypothetical protein